MVKVGDIVTVRKDLVIGEIYGNQSFVYEMDRHRGFQLTISYIQDNGCMYVKEAAWIWTEEMFEKKSNIIEVW